MAVSPMRATTSDGEGCLVGCADVEHAAMKIKATADSVRRVGVMGFSISWGW